MNMKFKHTSRSKCCNWSLLWW